MCNWPYGMAKCDENKYDKDIFQLAAVDLNSVHLWCEIVMTDIVF